MCAISTVEPSLSFEHRGTHMVRRMRPCPVVYHYQIDAEVVSRMRRQEGQQRQQETEW